MIADDKISFLLYLVLPKLVQNLNWDEFFAARTFFFNNIWSQIIILEHSVYGINCVNTYCVSYVLLNTSFISRQRGDRSSHNQVWNWIYCHRLLTTEKIQTHSLLPVTFSKSYKLWVQQFWKFFFTSKI